MEDKQINIISEANAQKLIFNINMEKIKTFEISLEKMDLSKDEIINNLVQENNELKNKVKNLEIIISDLEEKLKNFEKNFKIEKSTNNNVNNTNEIN